jgi:hypothetical protein
MAVRANLFTQHPATVVLSAHDILEHLGGIERLDGPNDFGLLGADRICIEGDRRLHCRHRKQLKQVVGHHVAKRAGLLVEHAALLDTDRLRNCNLNMVDLLPIPKWLKKAIGKT